MLHNEVSCQTRMGTFFIEEERNMQHNSYKL